MEEKPWDGTTERRRCSMINEEGLYCSAHIKMIEDVTTIKTILRNIESGMASNKNIVFANVGVLVVLITQIVVFAYLYGGLARQVEINTERWERYLTIDGNSNHAGVNDDRMSNVQ